MNCKTVHNKLIFFLDKELPVSEMKEFKEHLNNCLDCALFAEELSKTLGILETDKIDSENPFFYTRVTSRLKNNKTEQIPEQALTVRILQTAAFAIILLFGVYSGIKLGQPHKTQLVDYGIGEQQMIPYLNEMDAEPIEAFLME